MCFDKKSDRQKPRIARKNILAFKRLKISGNDIESPHQGYPWKVGRMEQVKFVKEYYPNEVNEGLHCYVTAEVAIKHWIGCTTMPVIIPKGARYYINETEIVSEKLLLVSDRIDDSLEAIKFLINQK